MVGIIISWVLAVISILMVVLALRIYFNTTTKEERKEILKGINNDIFTKPEKNK